MTHDPEEFRRRLRRTVGVEDDSLPVSVHPHPTEKGHGATVEVRSPVNRHQVLVHKEFDSLYAVLDAARHVSWMDVC